MKYLELRCRITTNIFTIADAAKYFFEEKPENLKVQLIRFVQKGYLKKIKRGIYCFDSRLIDELDLVDILYHPSYISLESALHYYDIIPDVPQAVTAVTPTTTKKIKTPWGIYYYKKIKPELFFGYKIIKSRSSYLKIASKEKALLDYFYIRKIKKTDSLRLDFDKINKNQYQKYLKNYPNWIKRIKLWI